ncbi:MAG: PD40 domain-containing protein, partial [Deltaproteobacteria bacterium]|nr:PD40 domain-containing protein [Deltaproteobacteria bacterium]
MAKAVARAGKTRPSKSTNLKPFDFAGLMGLERISAPAVSPDGRRVAFVVSKHDPKDNKVRHQIRALDLRSREIETLTPGPGNHTSPAWSPDGKWLAFVSDRDDQHGAQLWLLPTTGGEARRVTSGWGGVGTPIFAPDSRRVLFSREVVVSEAYDPKA